MTPADDSSTHGSAPEAAAGAQVASEAKRSGFSLSRLWGFTRMFPWTFLLILASLLLQLLPAGWRERGSFIDYAMIVAAVVVLVLEVAKAADIKMSRFVTDVVSATAGVVIASSLLTYYITQSGLTPSFYHWMVAGVLIVDAILSPIISFATALRNMSMGEV